MKGSTVVLDEIHRLENPSKLLKIAAESLRQADLQVHVR